MAVISKIKKIDSLTINPRGKEVVADIGYNEEFFQIRTYKKGDVSMDEGSKQNIQLTKSKAMELRELLNEFIYK